MIDPSLIPYRYFWPTESLKNSPRWIRAADERSYTMGMPERREDLAADSR